MTATGPTNYRWMATLLDLLFSRYERPDALTLLRDPDVREQAITELATELEAAGMPPAMLVAPEGQNLFVAVLALRLKFTEREAHEKVALNIAMREGRPPQ
ncbi:MAG: hypothetical protein M3439_10830 [Chloroflexota bacterium]|nr:hypothetical protein [Chloroflexota bacterium]